MQTLLGRVAGLPPVSSVRNVKDLKRLATNIWNAEKCPEKTCLLYRDEVRDAKCAGEPKDNSFEIKVCRIIKKTDLRIC